MAFSVGATKKGLTPAMNVTPLVDVVLVLLIIFMVMTPLLTKHVAVPVPPKASDEVQAPTDAQPPIVVTLDSHSLLAINGERVESTQLVDTAQRMLNARPDKVVFFDAHSEQPYEKAVEVMDMLRAGGIETVAVLAEALAAAE
jgi:biopolymer transport protein ExbD